MNKLGAIASALALGLAALGTILLAPNSTTIFSYALAVSAGRRGVFSRALTAH